MERKRYIARRIQHWHIVMIADGKETVVEITDSEEAAKAEATRLDREAELRTGDKPRGTP
jgi:Mg-chelatase subunit ChlD